MKAQKDTLLRGNKKSTALLKRLSVFSPGSQGNYNTNMHMINGIRP